MLFRLCADDDSGPEVVKCTDMHARRTCALCVRKTAKAEAKASVSGKIIIQCECRLLANAFGAIRGRTHVKRTGIVRIRNVYI